MKHDIHTVKRAMNGDAGAFEELLFKEEKMLYYKALSYVGKKEDALDVIQETACNAFLSLVSYETQNTFQLGYFAFLFGSVTGY